MERAPPTMYGSTLRSEKKVVIVSQFGEPKRKTAPKCLKNVLEPPTRLTNFLLFAYTNAYQSKLNLLSSYSPKSKQ